MRFFFLKSLLLVAAVASAQEGTYQACMRYAREGGCSETSEHVTALAWVRLSLGPGDRAELGLRLRGQDLLVPWEEPQSGFSEQQTFLDLRWTGTFSREDGGGIRIALAAPAGEGWERGRTGEGFFLPRDTRPEQGMRLDCALAGEALSCERPGDERRLVGHLAGPAYFMFEGGVLTLSRAPGVLRERSEDTLYVHGVLPGGEPAPPGPVALDAALAAARLRVSGADPDGAREAGALLAVCDPGGVVPAEAVAWLRAPAPSEEERKQIAEYRKKAEVGGR